MFLVPALWPAMTQEWGYRDVSDAPVTSAAMDSEGLVQVGRTEELRWFLWFLEF